VTGLRFVFAGEQAGPKFKRAAKQRSEQVLEAMRLTANQAAITVEDVGRADISAGGNFSSARWQGGLHAVVSEGGSNILITVSHDMGAIFGIFEFGGVIHGKPLLWIPLSFATDALGVRARDFSGGLFRVDRKSGAAPLLLSIEDRQPKYFGKESVTMPQKFHIRRVTATVARGIPDLYRHNISEIKQRG
jgi:hypothetical protein